MTWHGDQLDRIADVDQVTEAYQAKYSDQPGLVAMFLKAPATEATLRVDRPGT